MKKTCAVLLIGFFSLFCLLSCGLEAFYYIDYIPQGRMEGTNRATLTLPSSDNEGYSIYFENFIIFYRIYISDIPETTEIAANDDLRRLISSALNSDYNSFYPKTDITSTEVDTANLENAFFNRKYFLLTLENANIANILGSGSLGKKLEIFFSAVSGEKPTLILGGVSYVLWRAIEGPSLNFTPKPNRYFLNHGDLYDPANITNQINADVAANSKTNSRYTYVSMYIAARGKSLELPPKYIYSQPTFIGIFRLAESS